jgi:phosphate transport system permease protein
MDHREEAPLANGVRSESAELKWPVTSVSAPRIQKRLNIGDWMFRSLTALFAVLLVCVLGSIVLVLLFESWGSIRTFGWGFLTGSKWDPVFKEFGALPFIYGTLVSSILALLQAVPLSVGTALFLSELAPNWLRAPVSFLVELLATIPSVIYGLWGIFVLIPWVRTYVGPALSTTLGFLPFFQGPNYGVSMLTASMILAVMVVPYVTSVTFEVIQAVPTAQREAALALGATKWEMLRMAVLPYGRTGIIGAVILGLGRAIGETMAVTMVIGNRADISASLFAPGATMASVIANEFAEATYDLYVQALVEVGLVLLIITVLVNALARLLVWTVAGPQTNMRGV